MSLQVSLFMATWEHFLVVMQHYIQVAICLVGQLETFTRHTEEKDVKQNMKKKWSRNKQEETSRITADQKPTSLTGIVGAGSWRL